MIGKILFDLDVGFWNCNRASFGARLRRRSFIEAGWPLMAGALADCSSEFETTPPLLAGFKIKSVLHF